ncbi:MAG: NAD(P)H-dependent oxidoreductase [Bacillota bacterium]
MSGKKLLLLNGSPRKKGTSFSFARTIQKLAVESGSTVEIVHIIDYYDGKEKLDELQRMIVESDIMGIIAPIYSDTLPFFNIWLLEKLADERGEILKGKGLFALGQCGFPDVTRVEPLLNACEFFAGETGMHWYGGLAYGGGPLINGALLEDLGKKGEKITLGLRLALENIIGGEQIPAQSQEILTVKIPKILNRPLAAFLNYNTKKLARKNGNADYARKAYL